MSPPPLSRPLHPPMPPPRPPCLHPHRIPAALDPLAASPPLLHSPSSTDDDSPLSPDLVTAALPVLPVEDAEMLAPFVPSAVLPAAARLLPPTAQ